MKTKLLQKSLTIQGCLADDEDVPEGHKRCSKCKELKEATRDQFGSNSQQRDGLHPSCKACYNAVKRAARAKKRAKE